jgi:hypothetical protein
MRCCDVALSSVNTRGSLRPVDVIESSRCDHTLNHQSTTTVHHAAHNIRNAVARREARMTTPTADWEKVGDKFYRKLQLYTQVFDQDLELENYNVVGCSYGGAIGMCLL